MKKYFLNAEEVSENNFYEKLESDVDLYVNENYNEIIDDLYEPYDFGNFSICASTILEKCDPIAYRVGINDEQSVQLENYKYELESGAAVEICDNIYYIVED